MTNTRKAGSGFVLMMLFCTQLAPARHVIQVGEKMSTSRGWPPARLNSDRRAAILFSDWTGTAAGPAADRTDDPGTDGAWLAVHEQASKPTATAAPASRPARVLR